jgi:predicted RNA-binding Zn ribbon-like protein
MNETCETTSIEAFELSGGALCLDFANTWGDRSRPESDRLSGYPRLVSFAVQSECIDEKAASELSERGRRQTRLAADVLRQARQLREALYQIFSAKAAQRELAAAALEQLNAALATALAQQRLLQDGDHFGWTWASTELALPLWPIARSAADLLTSDDLPRIRECDADNCDWLFLDRSRSRSRRWCSMESCGNRAKARRHYQRCRDK